MMTAPNGASAPAATKAVPVGESTGPGTGPSRTRRLYGVSRRRYQGIPMLGKLFRPRWRHQNADQRLRAVTELSLDQPQSHEILASLAREDSETTVRARAASRVTDIALLMEISRQDTSDSVRDAAGTQLQRLLAGTAEHSPALALRLQQLQQTDDPAVLLFVARNSPDADCRLTAAARLDNPEQLLEIAVDGRDAAVRIAAAERITDAALLRRLVREGRDKRVQQHAREQLRQFQQSAQAAKERSESRAAVLAELTQHGGRAVDALYRARLTQLQQQWAQASADASAEEQQRFQQAEARCLAKADELDRQLAEAARRQAMQAEQQAAIDGLMELQQELSEELLQEQLGSLRAAIALQQHRWQAATEEVAAEPALAERFRALQQHWQTVLETTDAVAAATERLTALTTALSATPDDEALRAEAAGWLQRWPASTPRPAPLAALAAALQPLRPTQPERARTPKTAERAAIQQPLDNLIGTIQRALRQRNLRHANRLWQKAEAMLAEQPDETRQARLEKLRPDLDELRDWHAFAAEPKKIELCERMEALARQALDPAEKATAIQALHEEWRSLMSSNQDIDQHLWDRFKAASDLAYEPCREHFREQDAERADNLARRVALCDQLEQLLEKIQAQPEATDWPTVFTIRRQAPEEFRGYEPVRFTDARNASRRFSQLLGALDEQLKQTSTRHAEMLTELCDAADALLGMEDVQAATGQAKQLQQRWKQTGWVHPQPYRALHRRFRKTCDALFARQHADREAARASRAEERAQLEQALQSFSAALPELAPAQLREQMQTLEALPCPRPLLRQRDQLLVRAREQLAALPRLQLCQQLQALVNTAPDAAEETPAQRELAVAVEVTAEAPSPEEARQERLRWQLEKLPAAMTRGATDRLEECSRLLRDAAPVLDAGLAPAVRSRLLQALALLTP